jgi:hypothetical protein
VRIQGELSKLGHTCSWRAQGRFESLLFVLRVFAKRRAHLRRRVHVYLVADCVELSCF